MSTISAFGPDTQAALASGRGQQALNTEEFMQLLITELTNQDPFEPMKNQDLLNQISSIQELESNQRMSNSFDGMVNRFDGFIGQLDTLLLREQLSTASRMIGQLVSGTDTDGNPAFGQVRTVSVKNDEIMLDLDTGQTVAMSRLDRLGGAVDNVKGTDLIGRTVLAETITGEPFVGAVQSLRVNDGTIELMVRPNNDPNNLQGISLNKAQVIDETTIDLLVGLYAKGADGSGKEGQITGYLIDEDGIQVILDKNTTNGVLPLSDIQRIASEPIGRNGD